MEPHEDVGTLGKAADNEFVGAEGAVGKQQVALPEVSGEHGGGLGVMLGVRAGFDVLPATMTEVEQADDAHGGKAAAGLLHGWLGIKPLVFLGVHQVDGTAIHSHEDEATPLVLRGDAVGKTLADALMDRLNEGQAQPTTGLAVAGGVRRGDRKITGAAPALDKSDCLLAGGVCF